jgi:23S rRNA (uridine2552-2'-O)-methyltransferase
MKDVQRYFTKVARMHVDASRSTSREFFAVALGRKKPQPLD